jgi:hypothetical protein
MSSNNKEGKDSAVDNSKEEDLKVEQEKNRSKRYYYYNRYNKGCQYIKRYT